MSNFLCPPIAVVFVMAIFWDRTTEPGAFWGLAIGLTMGIIRMILEFSLPGAGCGSADPRPYFLSRQEISNKHSGNHTYFRIHYLHFAMIITPIVATIVTVISLLTPPIDQKNVS